MENNLDVLSGWKKVRHDPWHKVLPSRAFNWMVSVLTGVKLHDHNCGMKCYRREVFREVRLYGELHRFVPVLASARGFRVGEIVINHRPRKFGRSKYGFTRFVKGFLDLLTVKFLTGFGQRPQHRHGRAGVVRSERWDCGGGQWVVSHNAGLEPIHLPTARPAHAIGLLLLGGQLMSIGFLASCSLRTRPIPIYSISGVRRRRARDHW